MAGWLWQTQRAAVDGKHATKLDEAIIIRALRARGIGIGVRPGTITMFGPTRTTAALWVGAPPRSARLTTVASTFDPCFASTSASTDRTGTGGSSGRTMICDAWFRSIVTVFLPIFVLTVPNPRIGPTAIRPRAVYARGVEPPISSRRSLNMNFASPTLTSLSLI